MQEGCPTVTMLWHASLSWACYDSAADAIMPPVSCQAAPRAVADLAFCTSRGAPAPSGGRAAAHMAPCRPGPAAPRLSRPSCCRSAPEGSTRKPVHGCAPVTSSVAGGPLPAGAFQFGCQCHHWPLHVQALNRHSTVRDNDGSEKHFTQQACRTWLRLHCPLRFGSMPDSFDLDLCTAHAHSRANCDGAWMRKKHQTSLAGRSYNQFCGTSAALQASS